MSPMPKVIFGIAAINLLPDNAPNKLDALSKTVQVEMADSVLFVGDEETDELVFLGAPPNWIKIKVGKSSHSRARFYIDSQEQIEIFLALLLDRFPIKTFV